MHNSLLFDFTVDKSTNRVYITREFDAPQQLVWDAFTKAEILDQWWAPKPWYVETKYLNFTPGGRWFYAMCGPEREKHWCIQDYISINPISNFTFTDAFADENEVPSPDFSGFDWNLDFSSAGDVTTVSITIQHKTLADLEKVLEMGFKEGFTMTLNYLAELLNQLKRK
ncbi:MAG: hypothetical protein AMXMBFR48_09800 [Ignavibacteriales bacterium]